MKFDIVKYEGWNLLHVEDLPILRAFNKKAGEAKFAIRPDLLPEPFIGIPDTAKVLFLALNPGYKGPEDDWHSREEFRKLIIDNSKFRSMDYPYYYLNEAPSFRGSPGHIWHKRILSELINAFSAQILSKNICCIQFHGYHSTRYKPLGEILPSQRRSFELVKSVMKRNIPIVLMRSRNIWFDAISDLKTYPSIIILNNYRSPTVSKGNMSESDYGKIMMHLATTSTTHI